MEEMDLETHKPYYCSCPFFNRVNIDMWKNGNSFKPAAQTTTNVDGSSTTLAPGPVTTEEKAQKKNDVKARNIGVNTNGSQLVYEDLEQIHEDDIEEIDLKWQLALLSMRTRRLNANYHQRERVVSSNNYTREFDEGYVTFGGGAKGGKITGNNDLSKILVYNIRTRKVEESLHIRFLEDKHIITGDGPKWLFDIDILTKSMNYVPVVAGYKTLMIWHGTEDSIGNASNDEPQPSSDAGKKDDEGVKKESGINDQERHENSTQNVNAAGPSINTASINVNTGSLNINTISPTVTTAPLEAKCDFFGDEIEIDMSNITTTYLVPSTPNTRIHKDHSLDHVIGDVQSGVQTRRMIKDYNMNKEEPKKTLVDLPYGKRAIGTKWVYRNKKDERGIVIRNKTRLVAQGYTQEEGIDYDEIFAPVARIEAIRLFLAYASFKDFVVYQMDVKSAFLYGKIEEEVYVCQPLVFEDQEFTNKVYKVEKALYGLHQAPRA
ncbi:putative ribonuclease H-like domain-containing protein, partial [Tanacetum coccineum]